MQQNNEWKELIIDDLKKQYPNFVRTQLNHSSNITLLIAIILSARTKDDFVNKFCYELIKMSFEQLRQLSLEQIKYHIKSINFYERKSVCIFNLIRILEKDINFIYSKENLISIKGIGNKTANVFLNLTLDKPLVGVDVHVHRTVNRIFGLNLKTPNHIEKYLNNTFSEKYLKIINSLLVHHGRNVCKAKPLCFNCCIKEKCIWFNKK